jgi:heme-binding protein
MRKQLKQAAVVFVVVFAAAQLIRPGRANPPTDATRTIQAHSGTSGLAAVLDRSCRDCHSNETVWPWYTQVAPLSWLMARAAAEGRQAVNFSEWAAYSPEEQRLMLAVSCDDATSGKMPGAYTFFKPETGLSAQDIQTICAAAREVNAHATGVSE